MTYPPISDAQYNALPEAFKAVIDHDGKKPEYLSVVKIEDWPRRKRRLQAWEETKESLRKACAKVVKK